ncbi:hypothetical protein F4679DRAFT_552706 [Xylaria curta]|nr:hypothetical protein F4679DRAFT_552706 [Xylaria curta]
MAALLTRTLRTDCISARNPTNQRTYRHLQPFSPCQDPCLRLLSSTAQRLSRQTLTENIVQRYALDLPEGHLVRSGDYVSLSPAYCIRLPLAAKSKLIALWLI